MSDTWTFVCASAELLPGEMRATFDEVTGAPILVPVGSIDLGVGMPTLPTIIDDLLVVGGSGGELGEAAGHPGAGGVGRFS